MVVIEQNVERNGLPKAVVFCVFSGNPVDARRIPVGRLGTYSGVLFDAVATQDFMEWGGYSAPYDVWTITISECELAE